MTYRSELLKRKRGRPPYFKTAGELWQAFVAYCDFVDQHPIELPTYVSKKSKIKGSESEGKGGKVARPLTLDGFLAFHGVGSTWTQFSDYTDKRGEDFSLVISRIRACVRADQIEGGLAGIYNSNLTARLNGLTDRQDVTSEGRKIDRVIEIVTSKE